MSFDSSGRRRLSGGDDLVGRTVGTATSSSSSHISMTEKPARNEAAVSEFVPEKEGRLSESKRRRSASPLFDRSTTRSAAAQDGGAPGRSENGHQQSLGEASRQHTHSGVPQTTIPVRRVSGPPSGRFSSDASRPGSSTSHDSLAHLSSWSAIAQDLPQASELSPRAPTSPVSVQSARSRASVSSRGSSPHAPSSSSSSSRRRLRYASDAPQTPSRSASQIADFRYELIIHQQPGTAAAAGLSPAALSRLPIVPSPILQLHVTDDKGVPVGHRFVLQNLPYLVCSCSLVSVGDSPEPIDFATEELLPPANTGTSRRLSSGQGMAPTRRPSQPLAMLCGTRVYSSAEALDLENQAGIFFVFWDVSVRQIGEYRLKFSLVEALPGSSTLATVMSEPFTVVQRSGFPGMVEIATTWTRHMHRQGLSIYLPALGTSSAPSTSASTTS